METKTINDLVRISTRKSKRISSNCFKLGSKPRMIVPFPLIRVVLQNRTADHINHILSNETDGTKSIECYEHSLPHSPMLSVYSEEC